MKNTETPGGLAFNITKIGHVVLEIRDLEPSVAFYTGALGFRVSDADPDSMMPGAKVFRRCRADHHGVALDGGAAAAAGRLRPRTAATSSPSRMPSTTRRRARTRRCTIRHSGNEFIRLDNLLKLCVIR